MLEKINGSKDGEELRLWSFGWIIYYRCLSYGGW